MLINRDQGWETVISFCDSLRSGDIYILPSLCSYGILGIVWYGANCGGSSLFACLAFIFLTFKSTPGFLNPNTVDGLNQIILWGGTVLCIVSYLAAYLASIHQIPGPHLHSSPHPQRWKFISPWVKFRSLSRTRDSVTVPIHIIPQVMRVLCNSIQCKKVSNCHLFILQIFNEHLLYKGQLEHSLDPEIHTAESRFKCLPLWSLHCSGPGSQ